jgi:hypothetical protein
MSNCKLNFAKKKFFLDPDWIRFEFSNRLDPDPYLAKFLDPDSVNTDPKHWFLIMLVATEVPYSGVIGICLINVMNCVSGEVKLPQLMEDDNDTEMQPIHTVYR